MEWVSKVLDLFFGPKRLYIPFFGALLVFRFFCKIEASNEFYGLINFVLIFLFIYFIFDLYSFFRANDYLKDKKKNRELDYFMRSLSRDQVLFIREFFIRGQNCISMSADFNPIFIDELIEGGVLVFGGASFSGLYGSSVSFLLSDRAKTFVKDNMDYFFEGFSPGSDEIAKQRPQYLVEGQRQG